MDARSDVVKVFEQIANVASSAQRKLSYLLSVGLAATAYLSYEWLSAASPLWWNILKLVIITTPIIIWWFVWSVLGDLKQAPACVANLASGNSDLIPELKSIKKPSSIRGVFSVLRAFRREESFAGVFDVVSGIGIIANPFFAILAFIALPILLILILISVLILIF